MGSLLRLSIQDAGERCTAKSVALVGNAPEVLHQGHGARIDSYDVVIRMNAGVPRQIAHHSHLGTKTTILTVGKVELLRKALKFCRPEQLWHMKLTASGDREWGEVCQLASERKIKVFRWPQDQEDRMLEKVGSPPSSGIRVLDLLQQWGSPRRIGVFGCNWFGAAGGDRRSWWNLGKQPAPAHDGRNEYECFLSMGFAQLAPGWWEARMWTPKRLKVASKRK